MNTNKYRSLTQIEIEELLSNNNSSEDWDSFFVSENFNPSLIKNNQFRGEIFVGHLTPEFLNYSNIKVPVGIYNSLLDSVTIGKQVAIHNVKYLSNYLIGNQSLLFNIGELTCSAKTTFGNGHWIKVSNENGGRKILSFEGIREADAFMWSKFRDDRELLNKLEKFTNDLCCIEKVGSIADHCVIKNIKSIENTKVESYTYIDGAHLLKNISIQSNSEAVTYIGNAVELKNGVVGFGNHIESGSKCINFITGRNVSIELGARVLNTFVGSNSTIACCEVLHNLLFPFHEQHHNNSFLIASTLMGQSNIAAGATIGSNHNSRAADGEILAQRGFWPGLNTSFKHNSIFASFTLVAKASFETELNIPLPFSLVSKDPNGNVQLFPAFWFRYNMYALARNTWKFENRDKRKTKDQHIEYNYLAPDTAWEIFNAILILEDASNKTINEYDFNKIEDLNNVYLENIVPNGKVLLIKPLQAIWLFKNMISYYAATEIINFLDNNDWDSLVGEINEIADLNQWCNFGGQLIEEGKASTLMENVKTDKLKSWNEIHTRYDDLWAHFKNDRLKNSLACWLKKEKKDNLLQEDIFDLLNHSIKLNELLFTWAKESREKDYTNPFRKMNFKNENELNAVLGNMTDIPFIKDMQTESEKFRMRVGTILTKMNIKG